MIEKHPLVEVCVENIAAARVALEAGADRIELNSHLALDGLTPGFDVCAEVKREAPHIPLIAMLRPHAVGFIYDLAAQQEIQRDLASLLAVGVDGIAFGALNEDGTLNTSLISEIRRQTEGKQLVMHRAFDLVVDQRRGLETLIDLGVDRILTSGGLPSAELGLSQLRSLVEWGAGRIEILPGGGVRQSNAQAILDGTCCTQLHGTFKQVGQFPVLPDPLEIAAVKRLRVHLRSL